MHRPDAGPSHDRGFLAQLRWAWLRGYDMYTFICHYWQGVHVRHWSELGLHGLDSAKSTLYLSYKGILIV
jgi:hypothetical protein